MVAASGNSHLSQAAVAAPDSLVTDWDFLDVEFRTVLSPIHLRLSARDISADEATFFIPALTQNRTLIADESTQRSTAARAIIKE